MNIPVTPAATGADRIARTVQAFRTAARRVRAKYRRPNPLGRGVADCIDRRNRSLLALRQSAPAELVEAVTDEEALLTHLGFLRETGGDQTGARLALAAARQRRRTLIASLTGGTE